LRRGGGGGYGRCFEDMLVIGTLYSHIRLIIELIAGME
jgi:hypothetical protein